MAVRPIDGNELYRIEKLLDTDIVRQDKVALNLLEQVLYDIQHVPTLTPPNEWVSVEERLPEPGERVLATDCGFVGEFYINERGQWQRYNVNCHALLMAALSMMDIFPDAKKEARTDALWLLVCVVVIVLGSVING